MTETTPQKNTAPLYQRIASQLVDMIDEGTFRTGDKMPSIRALSSQFQVSINTAKSVYSLLEDRCLIEARPQSGYYVRPRLPELPQEPAADEVVAPSKISSTEMVMRLMQDTHAPEMLQFGAAIPAPDLIPTVKLNRILSTVVKRYGAESVSYAIPPGSRKLRVQIAKRMVKAGCVFNPDEIVITTGAAEAVYLALRTICTAGDTVAVGAPFYYNFVQMFKELDLRVLEIPSSPITGINIELLDAAVKQHPVRACLIISNFNNPLGISITDKKKQQLAELAHTHDIALIEDDINGDLSFNDERPTVVKTWDKNDRVLLCSSFSKTLAPGYRVGWIAAGRHNKKVQHQKLVTNLASATPPQLAVAEFLENGGYDYHLRTVRRIYARRTAQMAEAIGRYFPEGTRVSRPSGGFTLWLELPQHADATSLYSQAIDAGITLAPGALFSTVGDFSNCLRLNAAFWSEEYQWAVEYIGRQAALLS